MWAVEELFIIRAISHLQNPQFCVPRDTKPRIAIDHDHDLKLSRKKKMCLNQNYMYSLVFVPNLLLRCWQVQKNSLMGRRLSFHFYEQPTFACFLYSFLLKIPLEMVPMTLKPFAN